MLVAKKNPFCFWALPRSSSPSLLGGSNHAVVKWAPLPLLLEGLLDRSAKSGTYEYIVVRTYVVLNVYSQHLLN